MTAIVLQFSYQRDLGADLIAYFGHGAGFSHVDAVLPDGSLLGARSDVCQGSMPGVQIRPPHYIDFDRVLLVSLDATEDQLSAWNNFLQAQLGKPYDMEAIVGFAVGRDWRAPDSWFCSELQAAALESAGWFPFDLATPANKLDPDDLLLAISARMKVEA